MATSKKFSQEYFAWAVASSLSFTTIGFAQSDNKSDARPAQENTAPQDGANLKTPLTKDADEGKALPASSPTAGTPANETAESDAKAASPATGKAEAKAKAKTEVIQVTGSRIKQIDLEAAGSMTTFDRKAIEESGYSNVSDFLRNALPSVSVTSENVTNTQVSGSSSFSGRDFGAEYTLVLLNGRRMPNNAIAADFVDLNLIPSAAVERVEYLTDGASAIYGSDAVAGVLNIITRKNFEGTSVTTRLGQSSRGDGTEASYQIVSGSTSDRGSFMIAGDSFKREAVEAKDRDLSRSAIAPDGTDGRSPNGLPGYYVVKSTGEVKPFADCPVDQQSEGNCQFDYGPYFQVSPKSERQSIYTVFDYEIAPSLTLYGEARFSRSMTTIKNSPAPGATLLEANAPNNPVPGQEILVTRRYLEWGRRESNSANEAFATVGGIKGKLGDSHNWSFEIARHILRNLQVGTSGNIDKDSASRTFNKGILNPFIYNTFDTAEKQDAYNAINATTFREGVSKLQTYTLNIDGKLPFSFAAGEVGYATGVEFRDESFLDRSDKLSSDDKILGSASSDGHGSRKNEALYGEFAFPVLKGLDLSLAARHDRIDKNAEKTTYKLSTLYSPIEKIKLRATYGTGFKAPNMHDLFLGQSFGVQRAVDPQTCGNDQPCEINSRSGGNPDLKPEESKAYNFGIVAQVIDSISVRADYWDIAIENKVGELAIQTILNDQGRYDSNIKRDSATNRLNVDGAYVLGILQNLNKNHSNGVELGINYANNTNLGRVTSALLINKTLASESQETPGDPMCDGASASKGVDGTYSLDWGQGAYGAGATVRHTPSYDSYTGGLNQGTCTRLNPDSKFSVNAHNEADLRLSYTAPWSTEFGFGVLNITDEKPEFDRNEQWPWYNQDSNSNMGRYFFVSANHEFR